MILTRKKYYWHIVSWLLALVFIVPVLVMLSASIGSSNELFSHLWQTVLPTYITNTVKLSIYVVLLSVLFGVPSAALITQTNMYSKKYLRWLLLLPLAMPGYIVAYLYTDIFDYAGPVQRALRGFFEWQTSKDYWFFDIRSLEGASVVLALVLYPYVYMLSRTAFEQQDRNLIRAGQTLGLSPKQCFYKIAVPLARPAIMVSAILVMMETIADFATVQYFAVNTLTTAIYDTWLGYGDMAAANALASVLLFIVFLVVLAEQRTRAGQRHQSNRPNTEIQELQLTKLQQIIANVFCWSLVFWGFILPFVLLIVMTVEYETLSQSSVMLDIGFNTLKVSMIAATIAAGVALFLALFARFNDGRYQRKTISFNNWPILLSGFGYAIPGTVLAMAILATFGPLDYWLNDMAELLHFSKPGLVLSGTTFAIIFAFVVRFSAIANGTIKSGLDKIPHSLDIAPSSLGIGKFKTIQMVHVPLLKQSIFVAWLLVFVESMKELPAVLLLRPFNFDTLSTYVFQLISDERLEEGAIGAIFIVLFGLLPIIWLNRENVNAVEKNEK